MTHTGRRIVILHCIILLNRYRIDDADSVASGGELEYIG